MANKIIETSEGAQYSVDEAAFKRHYPDVKFKVIGEENDASFELVGVPKQRAPRKVPKAKAVKGNAAVEPEAAVEDEPESEPG